ncbi:MAG: hypothetical protein DRP82_08025, partial [Planctomycetota bacterium]
MRAFPLLVWMMLVCICFGAPPIPKVPSEKRLRMMVAKALERGRAYLKVVVSLTGDRAFRSRYKALKLRLAHLSINRHRAEKGQKLLRPVVTPPKKRKKHPNRLIEGFMKELDRIERRAYELERALAAGKRVDAKDVSALTRRLYRIPAEMRDREAALIGLALLRAGEPPDSDDMKTLISKAKNYIKKRTSAEGKTQFYYDYSAPLTLMFWEELLARRGMRSGLTYRMSLKQAAASLSPDDKKFLQSIVDGLVSGAAFNATRHKAKQKFWVWGAPDNSCTQFVMMGLRCALNLGLKVPTEVVEQAAQAVLSSQQEKGERVKWFFVPFAELSYDELKRIEDSNGVERLLEQSGTRRFRTRPDWGIQRRRYRREGRMQARGFPYSVRPSSQRRPSISPRLSTTVGGVCSLAIAKALLSRQHALKKALEERLNRAIRDGCGYIAKHFDNLLNLKKRRNSYLPPSSHWYFYTWWALERACAMTLLERLAGRDWWRIGATVIVHLQKKDGSWNHQGITGEQSTIATAFAMLFLARGTLPVVGEPRGDVVATGSSMFKKKPKKK